MARRPITRFRHLGLGAAALVCGTALACAGKSVRHDEDGDDGGEGGTQSTGGASGTASGGASGARGGSSGSATGGMSTGGTSGTDTCPACTPTTCTTTSIPTNTINDFDNLFFGTDPPIGIFGVLDEQGMPKPEWWLGYFSGAWVYPTIPRACSGQPTPTYALVQDDTRGVLRVTGTVGGPSGFGIWLGPCIIDMSGWNGVSFTIGGRTGSGVLEMRVGTSSTTDPNVCQIGRGKCDTDICSPPSVRLSIPDSTATIALPWTAFNGGTPSATVDVDEVVELRWEFDWDDGMTPYPVDVTLDNVMLFE